MSFSLFIKIYLVLFISSSLIFFEIVYPLIYERYLHNLVANELDLGFPFDFSQGLMKRGSPSADFFFFLV